MSTATAPFCGGCQAAARPASRCSRCKTPLCNKECAKAHFYGGLCDLQVDSGLDNRVTVVDVRSPGNARTALFARHRPARDVVAVQTAATGVVFLRSAVSLYADTIIVDAKQATHVFFDRRI